MTTIIAGTDRKDSMTLRVAQYYHALLLQKGVDPVELLSLEGIGAETRSAHFLDVEERILIPTERFVLVMPEYNGSFPGILKLLIDQSNIKQVWWHKKAMLVGLADGRAGNLRGLDHMTNILNYLKVQVFWNKVPISRIAEEVDLTGDLIREGTRKAVEDQVMGFLSF
jgi:NAD(P)H-dependent FMN reductase